MMNTNWKMIYLARRNPGLSAEDFAAAWREHSTLGRQCRNVQDRVRSVTQCVRILDSTPEGASTAYDGVNLLGLRDRESADAIWTDPETLAIMRPDEPRVFDRYVRDFTLVAREQLIQDGPPGNAVLVGFLKRRPDMEPADFACMLGRQPAPWSGVRRTVLNRVEPLRPPGYDYDVVMEWWFDDAASLTQALAGQALPIALSAWHPSAADTVFMATRVSHRRP